jgi:hypothetical protein
MSRKDKKNETLELQANPIKPLTLNSSANHAPSYEELRRRAYEIYLERDGLGGNEVDDWLQAEAELRGNGFAMRAQRKQNGELEIAQSENNLRNCCLAERQSRSDAVSAEGENGFIR